MTLAANRALRRFGLALKYVGPACSNRQCDEGAAGYVHYHIRLRHLRVARRMR